MMSDVMSNVMENCLHVQCYNEPAALERLLRVVRFRGFTVVNFSARLDAAGEHLKVILVVAGERPLHLLENQLRKNHDIFDVQVTDNVKQMAGYGA